MLDRELNNKNIAGSVNKSEELQQYIQTLQFFDDCIDDYIYIYDLSLGRVFLTDKFREKYPIPSAGESGNSFSDWNDIVYPKDRELMDHYRNLLFDGTIESFDIAYRIYDRQGNKVWVKVKGALRKTDDADSLLLVGRIAELSMGGTVDSLTGLCSIEKFMEDAAQVLKSSDGYLMILGVDDFKGINITQGRASGDAVLKKIAGVLDECSTHPMHLYRLNGDCFALNFIQKTQEDVEKFYHAVQDALENICTVSAGVVHYQKNDSTDSSAVYLYAETVLDKAKKEGKNRMLFFSADDYRRNLEQVELLAEMKASIQEGCKSFSLEYQPQIRGQDFKICGVEALLRYESPTRGRVSPAEFIPLLEQSGLVCPVGHWVLKTAASQCKKWRKHIPELNMSVNMSYAQLQQQGITDAVLYVLEEMQLPGEALTIEMTESVQLQNYPYFNKIFYIWKQHGIRISIDDFGTGYSSLSYLKSIEINEVKIDRCFVDHVQYNAYNFRLLSNMIELAHSAKIDVCCEGVETIEELIALQELHADILQGYFFAKPYTVEKFEEIYINADTEAYRARLAKEADLCRLESNESEKLLEGLRKEEIGNITESMDEMVYVSDPETYELYYMNATGRRMTGVHDYKGCKCYKVLQGRNAPCEFCTNDRLNDGQFLVWEMENKFLQRHFILKDKLIPWKGKMARAEIAFDIMEKEVLSQSIQHRLNFKRAVVDCCRALEGEADDEQAMLAMLKIVAEFCQGDRAYISTPCGNAQQWGIRWQWCVPGKDTKNDDTAVGTLDQGITGQIVRKDRVLGLIGVDSPKNREDDFLKIIAGFLGYVLTAQENADKFSYA